MRAKLLLFISCIVGITLASIDLFEAKPPLSLQSNSVARVNGVDISSDQYRSVIKGLSDARGKPVSQEQAIYILDELIDEELMIQRGYEIGLLQLNSLLRNNMKNALLESIIAENAELEPDDETLRKFYEENKDYFTGNKRVRITYMSFMDEDKAKQAFNAIEAKESFESVKNAFADKGILEIPDSLLSLKDLRKYLGPSLSEKIFSQATTITPILFYHQDRWHIANILEIQNQLTPEFTDIKNLVIKEYQRKENEKAIKNYISWLRKNAKIQSINPDTLNKIYIQKKYPE